MHKATSNKENPTYNTKNDFNKPRSMKTNQQIPPHLDKNSPYFDNTSQDYIIDENGTDDQLTKIMCPFNFNTTYNTSGNIYGNLSVNNINMNKDTNPNEEKQAIFFKDAFNSLLDQYTSMTQSLMNSNYNKRELKEIEKNQKLKEEELNSTITCILNIQKNNQNQLEKLIIDVQQCKNNLNSINDFFNNLNFHVTYPEKIKDINKISEDNKVILKNIEKKNEEIEGIKNKFIIVDDNYKKVINLGKEFNENIKKINDINKNIEKFKSEVNASIKSTIEQIKKHCESNNNVMNNNKKILESNSDIFLIKLIHLK